MTIQLTGKIRLSLLVICLALCGGIIWQCDTNNAYGPDNSDPYPSNRAVAVLTAIVPDSAKPGETVTIEGTGFFDGGSNASSPKSNWPFVWFGVDTAHVVEFNETNLKVIVPFKPDGLDVDSTYTGTDSIKIALFGSFDFSNKLPFTHLPW